MKKENIDKLLKSKNKNLIYLILIMGAVIMIFAGSLNFGEGKVKYYDKEEEKLQTILSQVRGVGEVSVMITYYDNETRQKGDPSGVKGVIVAADGAENAAVKNEISQGVQAALNLPANKVYIYVKNKSERNDKP